jgi:Ca-activated chloride channel family protein
VVPTKHLFSKQIFNKNTIYLLAWVLFAIALAGPRTALTQLDNEQLFGANIMLLVDHSRSMRATDITPSRIQRAKIEIDELLEKAQGHRIGITVFSARPHLYVPLTSDHAVLGTYLETLDNLSFPTIGSDYVSAILFAQNELKKLKGKSAIILITDGDLTSVTKNQLESLKEVDIPLYILGIGTVEGEAIQLINGEWLKYNQQYVISKMNEENLHQLSSQLNGKYSPVFNDDSDWGILYEQGIAQHNFLTKINAEQRIIWYELFPYFLIPSFILFWFSLSTRHLKYIKNITLFSFVSLFTFVLPSKHVDAFEIGQTAEQLAYRAYINKNYKKSEQFYKKISGYQSYYGQASSLYKMGHYHKAAQQFILATLNAENGEQRVSALYNLGNSYFRTGNFTSAINIYQDVLRYQPNNMASLHNIKVSQVLKKNIELQIKEQEGIISFLRRGRGSRSANVENGADISENTSVSVGDNENKLKKDIPLPVLPNISEDIVKKLILSGLENIRLAEQGAISNKQLEHGENITINLNKANQQLQTINDTQHLLWKRLFEIEEGFPAPVEKPKILPKMKPW